MASLAFRAGGPVAIAALAGLFVLAPARRDDRTVSASQDEDTSISATLKDQVDLAVTVYNSNIALVRDVRQVALPAGTLDLQLARHRRVGESGDRALPVAERAVASSASSSRTTSTTCSDPQRLLRKYVGRDVTLVRTRQRERHDDAGGRDARACSPTTTRRSGRSATRSSPATQRRAVSLPRDSRQPAQPADAGLEAGQQRRARSTGSRRRTWPATCRGTPTTCSPSAATTSTRISTAG